MKSEVFRRWLRAEHLNVSNLNDHSDLLSLQRTTGLSGKLQSRDERDYRGTELARIGTLQKKYGMFCCLQTVGMLQPEEQCNIHDP